MQGTCFKRTEASQCLKLPAPYFSLPLKFIRPYGPTTTLVPLLLDRARVRLRVFFRWGILPCPY